jgi:hypothetical protein
LCQSKIQGFETRESLSLRFPGNTLETPLVTPLSSELDPGKYPSVTILKYSEKACSEKSKWTAMIAEDILKFMLSDFARKGVFDEIFDEAVDWKGPPELVSLMQAHVAAPPVAPNIKMASSTTSLSAFVSQPGCNT